jgi:hypothetical protein
VLMPALAQGTVQMAHEDSPLTTPHEHGGAGSLREPVSIKSCERLGGLLKYYYHDSA